MPKITMMGVGKQSLPAFTALRSEISAKKGAPSSAIYLDGMEQDRLARRGGRTMARRGAPLVAAKPLLLLLPRAIALHCLYRVIGPFRISLGNFHVNKLDLALGCQSFGEYPIQLVATRRIGLLRPPPFYFFAIVSEVG